MLSMAEPNKGNSANHDSSEGGLRFGWNDIFETLKNVKELMAIAALLGGAVAWAIHYYATREELETLECHMILNMQMIQSTSDKQFNEQLAQKARAAIREEQRSIKKAESVNDEKSIRSSQDKIDEIETQLSGFSHAVDEQGKRSKKALNLLTNSSCRTANTRKNILEEIRSGKF